MDSSQSAMDGFSSSTPNRHNAHGSLFQDHENSRAVPEFTTLQREIEELKEYIASQDRQKSKPGKISLFLTNVYDRLFHFWILTKGQMGQFAAYLPPVRITLSIIFATIVILFLWNMDHLPEMAQKANRFLKRHVHQLNNPVTDDFTMAYNGYFYKTLRPDVKVNSFANKYLDNGRTALTCPVRFPVPKGWTLVPADDVADVVTNVVSSHFWSSSALILNSYDAYPTLALRSQLARPYPQATTEAATLPELVGPDAFKGMGPWFVVSKVNGQEWVQQNLLPVNTRECLMIVFSFASRGYRDDHVEDVVPACELCSANILIRKLIDTDEE